MQFDPFPALPCGGGGGGDDDDDDDDRNVTFASNVLSKPLFTYHM
jgi:hypothetical protein